GGGLSALRYADHRQGRHPAVLTLPHNAAVRSLTCTSRMSPFGPKRTWQLRSAMSTFGGKSDIDWMRPQRSSRRSQPNHAKVISSTLMQTSIPGPHILFIDGLPGSGKSMAAEAVGGYLSNSRIFLESAPNHPLLVAAPDPMGAAFADIHKIHSGDSFAA